MKRMKRNLKRALSLVLALALVLGMTSVSALADDDTDTSTTTESVELEVDGTVSYNVEGDYTSADTSALDTSVASVSLSEKSVAADGYSYVLYYTRGTTTYYLTFSVSSGSLTIGTASTYDEGTAVTYGTDSYLSFTSDGTTYYLNNEDGSALTADTDASTTWSYDESLGFYCTVSSVNYYLGSFIGYTTSETKPGSYAPSGSTMISYAAGATSGVYTLSFTEDSTTKYLVLSYDSSVTGYLSTTTTTDASEATQITFNGAQLYFTDSSTSTVYYLNIVPNSGAGYLIAQTSSATSYQASWTYDPDVGFFCRKSYTFYLLISAVTTSDTTSYSLVLSQSSSETTSTSTDDDDVTTTTTTSLLTANASQDITFYMTYSGYYLVLSADTGNLVSYTSTKASATELTYTTDGHLYFTDDSTKYYLVVSADKNLSLTTTESEATEVAYKLANGSAWSYGFTFTTVDSGSESDNLYLSGSPVLAESNMTTITFTGVAAGTTSVTIGGVTYSIDVSTQIITMYVGETRVVSLAGSYDSITVADESVATAELGSTTVNYTDSTVSTGSSFVIANKNSVVTYYYSFDYDSTNGLTAGAWTSYYSGTSVTFEEDSSSDSNTLTGYLKFTASDGNVYYLNVSGGVLTASATASTVWTYDSTNGFTYSVTSDDTTTTYTLYSLITALAPSATAFTPVAVTGGSYILGYAGDDGTNYLTFSYSDSTLTVGTTATYSDGTTVTYTSAGYLSFSSDDTTYYLTVDEDGKLTASTTGTAWTYDAETGFFYTNSDSVTYYLSGTGVSTASGTNMVEVYAVQGSSFELAYTDDYDTYYLTMTASSAGVNTTSSYYTVRTFTWTSDGYLTVSINSTSYYLSVSDGVLSLSTSSDNATTWSYDPDGGFYYTDSNSAKHYLTDYLTFTLNTSYYVTDGYGLTSGTAGTSITFTGVSEGTTTATISAAGAKYTIHVLDADTYVSSSDTPFYSDSAISKKMTSLYLSVGLSYTVYLGSSVSTGGTWEIGDTSVASITVNDDGSVTVNGVSEGTTTLSYTVDGVTYTMPVTIKDFWGYDSSKTVKTYSFYIAELTDSTAYMGILYGTSDTNVGNVDFAEVYEGEVIYISFPYNAGTAVDIFASPDEGYALTMMSSTNSASHYMALDSDDPGSTEFVAYVTAAGYNQIYDYGSEAVFNIVQAALDYDCDGAMGWTRPSTDYNYASSDIYIRSQKLPTVSKEITSVTKSGDTTATDYEEGMVISTGDVINYTVTITQYATTEAITYTNELLSDSLRVKIYLVYSIESTDSETGVVTITGTSTTDADEATEVTFDSSEYLIATIDGTDYYLYLNSSAELCGTTTKKNAGTWTYNLGTGLSYTVTVTGEDNTSTTTTYYLAGSAVTTTSGTNVVSILQRDSSSYVLGYSGVETYLTYTYSESGGLTVGTASAYSDATGMTYSGGYLSFTQDGTEYYLTVTESSDGTVSLTATSDKDSALTWVYSSTTGFSCTFDNSDGDEVTYYLSTSGVQNTPPSHVILGRLRSAGEIVLGYGSRSSKLTMSVTTGETTSSATQYQVKETDSTSDATATLSNLNLANTTLTEDTTYTYTVSYTVQESDVDLLLTNTVSLSYSYQSEYSSSVMTSATADTATLTVASFEMDDIVIDYGLPVDMDYSSHSTITLTDTDATASHGKITVKDNVITYTLTEPLSETDKVTVKSTGGGEYSFNVYPATQMYYEEDFGSTVAVGDDAEEHALIQYSSGSNSGSWSTVYQEVTETETSTTETDGTTTTATTTSVNATDKTLSTDSTYSLYRFTQETGVVASTSDSVYGSDASYLSNQYDSEYHSEKADVSEKPAAFRYYFTGTGTTIYSRTSEDSAYISVKLTYMGDDPVYYTNTDGTEKKLSNGDTADTWYIDTRNVADISGTSDSAIYAGKNEDGTNDDATLYNIPVYDITDLPYGEWKVYVYVYEKDTEVNYVYATQTGYATGYYTKVAVSDDGTTGYNYYPVYKIDDHLYYADGTTTGSTSNAYMINDSEYIMLYSLTSSSYSYSALFSDVTVPVTDKTALDGYYYTGSTSDSSSGAYYQVYYEISSASNDSESSTYTATLYYYCDGSYTKIGDVSATATTSDDTITLTDTENSTVSLMTMTGTRTTTSTVTGNTISVSSNATSLYAPVYDSNKSGSVFYLDGVRVYDPAGTQTTEEDALGYIDTDIFNAYTSDGENDPVVLNISDAVFSSTDSFATLTDVDGNIASTDTYTSIGPDNEVYLSPTTTTTDGTTTTTYDTISFYILNWVSGSYKIYLGMKSPNGTAATVKVGNTSGTENKDYKSYTLSNSVDCYYDITSYLTDVTNSVTIYKDGTAVEDAGTIEKVTVTVTEGLASLTNIKVIGASGYTIADSDSYSDTYTSGASVSSLTFASIDSDWIVVAGEENDSSGDDTSGDGSSGTDEDTNDSDNTTDTSDTDTSDSGSQDTGGTADDTDSGSSGTQDSDGSSGGVNDADSSTQSTASAALQIKSVKATYKNGKTTLKVTTSSSVKTLKVAGKSAKLTKTGKNKNVFTVKLNKDQRGKAVKMVMKSSAGKKKTKKILIPKKLKATAKYKAKTKKATVTIKTSKEVTKVKVNGKKAKRKKTKNGYTYTIKLKKKKGSSVNVVGYNKKKAATVTYSVKVK